MPARILVADDEPNIRDVIAFTLERAGLTVVLARNGAEALQLFRRGAVDLVVLDIGMPEMDGLEVCRQIRKGADTPILFLSARDDEIDRVLGLELGADDYVTKPFSPRELLARVNAILKRTSLASERTARPLALGPLRLDPLGHRVTFAGAEIGLTPLEFALLGTLLARPDQVFGREQLMRAAYGAATHVADRTVDSHIRNIRAKFAGAGCPAIILTVHGVGFRLGDLEPAG